jgi:hypothetical protein
VVDLVFDDVTDHLQKRVLRAPGRVTMVAVESAGVKVSRNRIEALCLASSKAMSESTVGFR